MPSASNAGPARLQVALPSALIHGSASNDPRVKELQEELSVVNRKILDNELDIPPEGQRSPSPEPQYDRNGIRLNTREVRGARRDSALCARARVPRARAARERRALPAAGAHEGAAHGAAQHAD